MVQQVYDRTRMLVGEEALRRIQNSKVILFGVGGVGGYVAEGLARAGVGTLAIVDFDRVDVTNINRQIVALHSTVGQEKARIMADRVVDINPDIQVEPLICRVDETTVSQFPWKAFDYVVDAVDDVEAKLLIIKAAKAAGIAVISSMGTGNKMNPGLFRIADIQKTHTCPLAKAVRKRLGQLGIKDVKVLFSPEQPFRTMDAPDGSKAPASISFVPAAAGIQIAGEVIRDLICVNKIKK